MSDQNRSDQKLAWRMHCSVQVRLPGRMRKSVLALKAFQRQRSLVLRVVQRRVSSLVLRVVQTQMSCQVLTFAQTQMSLLVLKLVQRQTSLLAPEVVRTLSRRPVAKVCQTQKLGQNLIRHLGQTAGQKHQCQALKVCQKRMLHRWQMLAQMPMSGQDWNVAQMPTAFGLGSRAVQRQRELVD